MITNLNNSELNIVYTTDDNYVPMCGVSLTSLFENNKRINNIHVYILGKNLSVKSKEKLRQTALNYGRDLTIIGEERVMPIVFSYLSCYSEYKEPSKYSDLAYIYSYRLVLGEVLPDSVEKVIYIGSDTLVVGELLPAYELELGHKSVAIAYDTMNHYYKKYIGLTDKDPYFNDDVLVIDLKKWRERKLANRIFEYVAKYNDVYFFDIQDAINGSIPNELAILPIKFNMMTVNLYYRCSAIKKMYGIKQHYTKAEYEEGKKDIRLCHFSGQAGGRPWYRNSKHPMKKEYDKYYYLSEWKNVQQVERKLEIPYKIQLYGYHFLPKCLSELIGIAMQRAFGFLNYRNTSKVIK